MSGPLLLNRSKRFVWLLTRTHFHSDFEAKVPSGSSITLTCYVDPGHYTRTGTGEHILDSFWLGCTILTSDLSSSWANCGESNLAGQIAVDTDCYKFAHGYDSAQTTIHHIDVVPDVAVTISSAYSIGPNGAAPGAAALCAQSIVLMTVSTDETRHRDLG